MKFRNKYSKHMNGLITIRFTPSLGLATELRTIPTTSIKWKRHGDFETLLLFLSFQIQTIRIRYTEKKFNNHEMEKNVLYMLFMNI